MEQEYLTIKEFAELVGVSVQSIYKRIKKANNPIHPYVKKVENKTYINRSAVSVLYNDEDIPKAEEKAGTRSATPEEKTANDRLIDLLEKQLDELRKQLAEKDNQIATQNEQITNLLNLISQQQQLTAMNTTALRPATTEENTAPRSSKKLLQRLFGRDSK